MGRKKNTTYFVYGYTRKLFCGDNGQPLFNTGVKVCSTWNIAKAIHEYAKLVQSAEFDHLILFRENEIFAEIDKPVA
jgi:hypothetical protein